MFLSCTSAVFVVWESKFCLSSDISQIKADKVY